MATLMKRRRIANHGRKRNPAKRKRMSAKQIKFFGTKRQRSALKNSASRRSIKQHKKRSGGTSRTIKQLYKRINTLTSKPRRKRRVKNVGRIVTLKLKNSGRKRRKVSMAKVARKRRRKVSNPATKRRRRRSVSAAPRRRRRRSVVSNPRRRRRTRRTGNPGIRRRSYRRYHAKRRSNPGMGEWEGMAKDALAVVGGAVGTKYLTQLVLGGNNVSYVGYIGNAVAAGLLGYAVNKVLKNKRLGHMIMLGGFTALALRVLQDQTPIGQYVNLSLNGLGKGGDIGIGAIEDSSFSTPVTWPQGRMSGAGQVPNYLVPAVAAVAPGMKGLGMVNRNSRRTRGRL